MRVIGSGAARRAQFSPWDKLELSDVGLSLDVIYAMFFEAQFSPSMLVSRPRLRVVLALADRTLGTASAAELDALGTDCKAIDALFRRVVHIHDDNAASDEEKNDKTHFACYKEAHAQLTFHTDPASLEQSKKMIEKIHKFWRKRAVKEAVERAASVAAKYAGAALEPSAADGAPSTTTTAAAAAKPVKKPAAAAPQKSAPMPNKLPKSTTVTPRASTHAPMHVHASPPSAKHGHVPIGSVGADALVQPKAHKRKRAASSTTTTTTTTTTEQPEEPHAASTTTTTAARSKPSHSQIMSAVNALVSGTKSATSQSTTTTTAASAPHHERTSSVHIAKKQKKSRDAAAVVIVVDEDGGGAPRERQHLLERNLADLSDPGVEVLWPNFVERGAVPVQPPKLSYVMHQTQNSTCSVSKKLIKAAANGNALTAEQGRVIYFYVTRQGFCQLDPAHVLLADELAIYNALPEKRRAVYQQLRRVYTTVDYALRFAVANGIEAPDDSARGDLLAAFTSAFDAVAPPSAKEQWFKPDNGVMAQLCQSISLYFKVRDVPAMMRYAPLTYTMLYNYNDAFGKNVHNHYVSFMHRDVQALYSVDVPPVARDFDARVCGATLPISIDVALVRARMQEAASARQAKEALGSRHGVRKGAKSALGGAGAGANDE